MDSSGKSVSFDPPAPRAPAVLDRLHADERALVALKLEIAEAVLADVEGKPAARENLAALQGKIAVLTFALDGKTEAHALALQLDSAARAAWKAAVQAMPPAKIIAGITQTKCCDRCREDTGCVITGLACAHPINVGRLPPTLQANTVVRDIYRTACEKVGKGP